MAALMGDATTSSSSLSPELLLFILTTPPPPTPTPPPAPATPPDPGSTGDTLSNASLPGSLTRPVPPLCLLPMLGQQGVVLLNRGVSVDEALGNQNATLAVFRGLFSLSIFFNRL